MSIIMLLNYFTAKVKILKLKNFSYITMYPKQYKVNIFRKFESILIIILLFYYYYFVKFVLRNVSLLYIYFAFILYI